MAKKNLFLLSILTISSLSAKAATPHDESDSPMLIFYIIGTMFCVGIILYLIGNYHAKKEQRNSRAIHRAHQRHQHHQRVIKKTA